MMDVPVAKLFAVDCSYFVYDTYKNCVLLISIDQFQEIQELLSIGASRYRYIGSESHAHIDVLALLDAGYLKSDFINEVRHPNTKWIKNLMSRCVHELVLEVTTECNFKCRYCTSFQQWARKESAQVQTSMSEHVAHRSIDFLFDHSLDAPEVSITFYGGEPLLNFDLISSVVAYSRNKFKTKIVRYNMTTNASLINDEVMEFFIQNNFSILVSLDGGPEEQNNHRKYALNGGDTFHDVFTVVHDKG